MDSQKILAKIAKIGRQLTLCLCLVIAMTFAWTKVSITLNDTANAAVLNSTNLIATTDSIQEADAKGKSALDKLVGAGTSNQIEGKVDQAIGKTKEELGNTRQRVEGAAQKLEGQTEENIGKAQNAAEKAAYEAEDKSENLIESVKSFFDN